MSKALEVVWVLSSDDDGSTITELLDFVVAGVLVTIVDDEVIIPDTDGIDDESIYIHKIFFLISINLLIFHAPITLSIKKR